MDSAYICSHLKKWSELFYGKEKKHIVKEKNGKYLFGTKKNKNILTKPVAIFLVSGQLPKYEKQTTNKKKNSSIRKKKKKN